MSQLNFFLSKDDVLDILDRLVETDEIKIFTGRYFEKEFPDAIKNINEIKEFDELTFWLKNEIKRPKCYSYERSSGHVVFLFDTYKDPIIEFSDCKRTTLLMSPGRIYYKAGWIENHELRRAHKNWAVRVTKLFYKRLKKLDKFWRISNDVESWVSSGGILELGPGGRKISELDLTLTKF